MNYYYNGQSNKSLDLNYVKVILTKVSFDQHLFEKELRKALTRLSPEEVEHLRSWCFNTFSHNYGPSLRVAFAG